MEAKYIAKRSAWGAVSVISLLLFGLIIPAVLGAGAYFVLTGFIALPFEMEESMKVLVCYGAFALALVIFLLNWIVVKVQLYRAKRTKYEFYEHMVVIQNSKVFSGETENKRIVYFPGMTVEVKQSVKGKFFNYGTVVISTGLEAIGDIEMKGIKKPDKAKKALTEYAASVCNERAERFKNYLPWFIPYFNM